MYVPQSHEIIYKTRDPLSLCMCMCACVDAGGRAGGCACVHACTCVCSYAVWINGWRKDGLMDNGGMYG